MSWLQRDAWLRRVIWLLRTCLGPVSHFHNDCAPRAYSAPSQYLVCDAPPPPAAANPKSPRAHAIESVVRAKIYDADAGSVECVRTSANGVYMCLSEEGVRG